jgi:hypothetical protein
MWLCGSGEETESANPGARSTTRELEMKINGGLSPVDSRLTQLKPRIE